MGRGKKKNSKSWHVDWLRAGGFALALWACANTYIDIKRYGADQGFYWWFCNLALIGTAGGLIFKSRGWITGFLSIACFTQIFWVFDNLARVLTHRNLFGMVEFMYQPGLPLDEFVLSHYHYYAIPISLLALYFLPQYRSKSLQLVLIFNPLIFGVSYFLFPAVQNVNCIHEPCFPGLESWGGPLYSFLFWASIFAAHIAICFRLERYFRETRITAKMKAKALQAFGVAVGVFTLLAILDTDYKSSLPRLTCAPPHRQDGVTITCRYTLDDEPNVMLLAYDVENRNEVAKMCNTWMGVKGEERLLQNALPLQPQEKRHFRTPLQYPAHDVEVALRAECFDPMARALTHDPEK